MADNFWEESKEIGKCEGLGGKEYRVAVNKRKGRTYVSIKEWWFSESENQMFPARTQGINIPEESFSDTLALLQEAEGEI